MKTLELAKELIAQPSVTPNDSHCQKIIAKRLEKLGFNCTFLRFGEVDNLWAVKGNSEPLFVFAGHTDVVPTGEGWDSPPFEPSERDGYLYGRGAADMKGSLAAMVVAVEEFLHTHSDHQGSIGFLLTSDEEGPGINGTKKVIEWLQQQNLRMHYCVVGEPSSTAKVGDVIKNGRRGSLNGVLTVHGKQGHVAYPHLAENPIHKALAALAELVAITFDNGNAFFPATCLQISNIKAGTGANNVIPQDLEVVFNFRFSTESTAEQLKKQTEALLTRYNLKYTVHWQLSGEPFLTSEGVLVEATLQTIADVTGLKAELSTSGGTSDARFIAPLGVEVVELGPVNATIHQRNECVKVEDLAMLTKIYLKLLENILDKK